MHARRCQHPGRHPRRGIVLLLILAMLSLVALIGVTFATLSGQARVSGQNFSQGPRQIKPRDIFDYALSQMLLDTNNPKSAARGHGILRDMYGHDRLFDPLNNVFVENGYLDRLPAPLNLPLTLSNRSVTGNIYTVDTNIPTSNNPAIQVMPDLYNKSFVGWTLKLEMWLFTIGGSPVRPINGVDMTPNPWPIPQSFTINVDDMSNSNHVFTLSPADLSLPALVRPDTVFPTVGAGFEVRFLVTLDGRYRRAFNGNGMSTNEAYNFAVTAGTPGPYILPNYPNFLYNNPAFNNLEYGYAGSVGSGYNDPNYNFAPSMDESWDAPDTENMFMAMKSADGRVVIPSYHRPWTIRYDPLSPTAAVNDWLLDPTGASTPMQQRINRGKFLRPRKIDHPASGDSFPDLVPDSNLLVTDPNFGQITYDVDNDGDGITDSVWIDLGYPARQDSSGRLFKPLFAIMCLPLNGRLPLNTAGNVQGRDLTGVANFDHAAGIGYSPNEVDPRYALNAPPARTPSAFSNLNVNYLPPHYLSTGALAPVDTTTLAGSISAIPLYNGLARLQTFLGGALTGSVATPGRFGETEALIAGIFPGPGRSYTTSAAGAPYLDSNFNTTDFSPAINPEASDVLDANGILILAAERFRRFVYPLDVTGNGRVLQFNNIPTTPNYSTALVGTPYGTGFDDFGRVSHFLHARPPGVIAGALPAPVAGVVDTTQTMQNRYNGFESRRNPTGPGGGDTTPNLMARAAWNLPGTDPIDTMYSDMPNGVETTNASIVTNTPAPASRTGSNLSANLSFAEAAQLDLYRKRPYDSPFELADLEFLLRRGDVDGSSLQSRLAILPDIDFFEDSLNRQLFSIETWEPNHYVLAQTPLLPVGFANRSHIAQRSRKIDLNFPLPPSNNSNELTRQKWCRETYWLLRNLLYPTGSTPTAEQLAALGQYVVNVVDFRDPDGAMTRFVHPELEIKPADIANEIPAGVQLASPGTLELFGMENLPVAINEVLAFQHLTGSSSAKVVKQRLYIEIVNLLTEDGNGSEVTNAGFTNDDTNGGTASDLDLDGWGFIITPANPARTPAVPPVLGYEQPNTFTGQLDQATIDTYFVPLAVTGTPLIGRTATTAPITPLVPALEHNGLPQLASSNTAYVFGTSPPATTVTQTNQPQVDISSTNQMDELVKQLPQLSASSGTAEYYWLHLLRPVNPLIPASRKVVVDSIRFPYTETGHDIQSMSGADLGVAVNAVDVYSVGRLQPYRGAQVVPKNDTFLPPYSFGYSDQVVPDDGGTGFDISLNGGPLVGSASGSIGIRQSMGQKNDPDEPGSRWNYFPFHDRDFQSVAELLMVPSVAPGLFTKFFAERRELNPTTTPPPTAYTAPPAMRPIIDEDDVRLQDEPAYPYLSDAFFYTSNDPTAWNQNAPVGWHRMLEFFEVPSPVQGAIGPVAEGENGDWLRQDLRPGSINLNVIFDEENFFGSLADPRLNTQPAFAAAGTVINPYPALQPADTPGTGLPRIVTGLTATGLPSFSYTVSDTSSYPQGRGFFDGTSNFMKAAFADFLKLRHGGSGFIGLPGSPLPGYATYLGTNNPEKPFRATSVADLHDTLMRPARLQTYQKAYTTASGYGADYPDQTVRPVRISIPPRMLFEIPDEYDENDADIANTASEVGDPSINGTRLNADHVNLWNPNAGFVNRDRSATAVANHDFFLGAASGDDREHPAFRYEWLEKVMNLSTVRSHQYAVWITVGFFEVVQEGNPQVLANPAADPYLAIDKLGREIGADSGNAVRHRMFAIIDRSKAPGFDPVNPGDFRDYVTYRRELD